MWYWCDSFLAGWWWIFPVMVVLCFLLMFFFMRRFFMGRFSCCGTAPGPRGAAEPDSGNLNTRTGGAAGPSANRFADFTAGG